MLERVCPRVRAPTAGWGFFCWLAPGLLVGTAVSSSLRLRCFLFYQRAHTVASVFYRLFLLGFALKFLERVGALLCSPSGVVVSPLCCAGRE